MLQVSHFSLQLAAKLALESVRKEVENSSRGPKTGQGVHGGGKQAARGRGRGRRRGEQVSSQIDSMHHFWNLYYLYAICFRSRNNMEGVETSSLSSLGHNLLKNQRWRLIAMIQRLHLLKHLHQIQVRPEQRKPNIKKQEKGMAGTAQMDIR